MPTSLSRLITRRPLLVVAAWLLAATLGNLAVPQLEEVVHDQSRSFFPIDAPASVAAERMGEVFGDADTNNVAYVVLEGDRPLGPADEAYYGALLDALRSDTAHVRSVLDLWSQPMAATVVESDDGRAVSVMLRLAGQLGSAEANDSVAAVRAAVARSPAPSGLHAYVTGPGATLVDEFRSIDSQMVLITGVTVGLIALLLLMVYRSVWAAAIPLAAVGLSLAVARPVVAALGGAGAVEISLFSVALMSAMVLGAGTDYSIFLLARYHEHRRVGVRSDDALVGAYRSVAPVILASALTTGAALACLVFTDVGMLRSAGIPCAIGILTTMVASLTLMPALVTLGGRRGLLEPRRSATRRRWRRVGTVVTRWPGPVVVVAAAALLVCLLPLLGMRLSFSEIDAQPAGTESNLGYQAMDRHFDPNALLPEIVAVEADRDLRNPSGLIAIEKVSRQLMKVAGVRSVQSASRPAGRLPDEASITYQAGLIGERFDRTADSLSAQLDSADNSQQTLTRLSSAIDQLERGMSGGVAGMDQVGDGAADLRSGMQTLSDNAVTVAAYLDPLREFVGRTPHCPMNPICAPVQNMLDPVDGMLRGAGQADGATAKFTDGTEQASAGLADATDALAAMRSTVTELRQLVGTLTATVDTMAPQIRELTEYLTMMRTDFAGTGEGGFYLPQQTLDDPRYQMLLPLLFSADGHATRMLVYATGDVWGADGADRAAQIEQAVRDADKDGVLAGATVLVNGVGSATEDLQGFVASDFTFLAVVTLALVLLIVTVMLRSPVAGLAVVATVVLSFGSALGLSALIWQHLLGHDLHWAVPAMAFIALVAVGADYNLLLAARLKEEAVAGMGTGLIRAFGGTGGVVTTAGIVFGLTMFAMLSSDVRTIAQVGSTIGIGLVLDTLIVRTLVVPAIAALLGRWFWWPARPMWR
ncbi:Siderophore exporter MmpL4 [Mycolicibacterium vanbaalenii]|uniref:Siderophore exporter MmpL4 n=1 Tax=Mycolicibacterium vanbaalenii TaxID=110539 RepID=A0A5S9R6Y2_MYCVN|nr:RND family transporter [Mycolicibacterium vanbaalenii]CAA0131001.1 Siderophore exporter MmpL4 [Mycolicibacterium vanbaalenii]